MRFREGCRHHEHQHATYEDGHDSEGPLPGAGTHPWAGIPGVLLSAEATCDCIATDHGLPPAADRDRPAAARASGGRPHV
jgi:hypothetical protein